MKVATKWDGTHVVNMESRNPIQSENPFPLIFKTQYDFRFDEIRSKVEDHVAEAKEYTEKNNRTTPEGGGGTSSVVLLNKGPQYEPPHRWKEFEPFINFIQRDAEVVWKEWNFEERAQKVIGESWINSHPTGGFTSQHHHHGIHMAMVAYLYVPENGGNLLVKNPMTMYQHGLPMSQENYYKNQWRTVEVKTNDVVILPAWLDHMTEVNQSEENRYVMSLNVKGFY
tara:strand:+ start:445 stop:1122 length:678 start_codon:yes stop_codon:yes gene_type:complete